MAEQQLVDYIKKAKEAGQTDDQTRSLLTKNGWTEDEIGDAFAALNQAQPQPQPSPEPKPQPTIEPEIEIQPQTEIQPQPQPQTQPQSQPQPQTQPAQNNFPITKHRSHFIVKFLMVLIIIVVLGAAGYTYAGQYFPLPYSNILLNLFAPTPETVINNMMTNMKNVKSEQTKIKGDIVATSNKANVGQVSFSIDGGNDVTDIKNPKADYKLTMNLTIPSQSPSSISAGAEIISVDSVAYFDLNNYIGKGISGFNVDKLMQAGWLKIDSDSVKAISQAEGSGVNNGTVTLPANNQDLVQKIQNLVLSENMLSVDKQLSEQVVSGQNTYHYSAKISKDKLKDLINKMIALQIQPGAAGASNSMIGSMINSAVGSITDAMGDINLELWIGKKDFLLYEVKLDKPIDINKIFPGANAQVDIKFDMVNSNFNKPVAVQAPASSQKIENVVIPLMKTQTIYMALGTISMVASSLPGTAKNYVPLCNKGLLNGYLSVFGSQLISMNNKIVANGGGRPVCFAAAQNYCVSTKLPDGSYMCVGPNTELGSTRCVSAATVCK